MGSKDSGSERGDALGTDTRQDEPKLPLSRLPERDSRRSGSTEQGNYPVLHDEGLHA